MMKSVTEHIREHLLAHCGFYVHGAVQMPSLEELCGVQWCQRFADLMKNRMVMGAFRYGLISEQPAYDHLGEIRRRLTLYEETGNQEYLVDIANFAHAEFIKPASHPNPHWEPVDDGIHMKTV